MRQQENKPDEFCKMWPQINYQQATGQRLALTEWEDTQGCLLKNAVFQVYPHTAKHE